MPPFLPPRLLRSRHVQTILATTGPRRWLQRKTWRGLERCAREVVLDAGDGVRLAGLLSAHGPDARDLVTLVHGWEGSARSLYVRSAAGTLFKHIKNWALQSWIDERIAEVLAAQ